MITPLAEGIIVAWLLLFGSRKNRLRETGTTAALQIRVDVGRIQEVVLVLAHPIPWQPPRLFHPSPPPVSTSPPCIHITAREHSTARPTTAARGYTVYSCKLYSAPLQPSTKLHSTALHYSCVLPYYSLYSTVAGRYTTVVPNTTALGDYSRVLHYST